MRNMKNRLILSSRTTAAKLNFDVEQLFADMLRQLGKRPRFLLSDRLVGFRESFNEMLYMGPEPESIQFANLALNGKHVNNNRHERQNKSLDEFLHGRRGFNSDHLGSVASLLYSTTFCDPAWRWAAKPPPRRRALLCRDAIYCAR